MPKVDSKLVAYGLAAIGLLASSMGGYVYITTPEAQRCEVELSAAKVRIEMLTEVKDQCKEALQTCAGGE